MTSALIGHTGFVGSNLLAQGHFDECYNSSNIEDVRGFTFDRIVCAGAPGEKWLANRDREADRANIKRLISCLSTVTARSFTLISTIDVYANPSGVDEGIQPCMDCASVYGANRLVLEGFARLFDRFTIVRLPALFGRGLKKNTIFDLMYRHMVDKINPDSWYQWYPLEWLSRDLGTIEKFGPPIVNIVTEPISTREISGRFFSEAEIGKNPDSATRYDVRTKHASLWGNPYPYRANRDEVLLAMERFLLQEAVLQ